MSAEQTTGIGQRAEQIVDAVLNELSGRRGIGNELEQIDEDVMNELRDTLGLMVRRILEKP